MISAGAAAIYLSRGSKGGRYQSATEKVIVEVPEISGNATGAGDAFVAGFASAKAAGKNLTETLELASACGSAAVLEKTGGIVSLDQVAFLKAKVKVVPE
jgi:tagatose 6-phosphate kinase